MDIGSLCDEELNGTQMTSTCSLHQGSSAAFRRVFQICSVLQQQLRYIRMPVLTGIRQRRITSARLGVNVGSSFQQVADLQKKERKLIRYRTRK